MAGCFSVKKRVLLITHAGWISENWRQWDRDHWTLVHVGYRLGTEAIMQHKG